MNGSKIHSDLLTLSQVEEDGFLPALKTDLYGSIPFLKLLQTTSEYARTKHKKSFFAVIFVKK